MVTGVQTCALPIWHAPKTDAATAIFERFFGRNRLKRIVQAG
jgi:hypothetical protein